MSSPLLTTEEPLEVKAPKKEALVKELSDEITNMLIANSPIDLHPIILKKVTGAIRQRCEEQAVEADKYATSLKQVVSAFGE